MAYKLLSDDSFRTQQQIGATSGVVPRECGRDWVANTSEMCTRARQMTTSSLDEAQIDFLPAGPTTTISSGPSLFQENVRFNLSDPDLVEAWHIYNVFRSKLKNKQINCEFFGLGYQGKDIVFRFIIEYRSLMYFGP